MLKNYDNFFLPASDLEQGREFYQHVLGLPVKFDFSAYGLLAFRVGDEEPAIILSKHPNTKPAILFEVDDVNATYVELKEKGVVFLSEPREINTGLLAEFEDPFGNRLGKPVCPKSFFPRPGHPQGECPYPQTGLPKIIFPPTRASTRGMPLPANYPQGCSAKSF